MCRGPRSYLHRFPCILLVDSVGPHKEHSFIGFSAGTSVFWMSYNCLLNTKYNSLGFLQPITSNFLHSSHKSFAEADKSHGLPNQGTDHSSHYRFFMSVTLLSLEKNISQEASLFWLTVQRCTPYMWPGLCTFWITRKQRVSK